MEKKRCNTPSNPAVGQYACVWAHLFTFLQVEERFENRRVCGFFKSVLDTPAAWRSIAIREDLTSKADKEITIWNRTVPVEVSSFEFCTATANSLPVREWGLVKLLTTKLRELIIGVDNGHTTTHDWITARSWEPCYSGLTTLTIPWCMALENSALLIQLKGLRSFTWTQTRNHAECDDFRTDPVQPLLEVLARDLVPRLYHLGLHSFADDQNDKSIDVAAARAFLPAASQLRSLSINAKFTEDDEIVLDCPGLQRLSLQGVGISKITDATAQTLERWTTVSRGIMSDYDTLPNFPVVTEFNDNGAWIEPAIHHMISKMPKVRKFATTIVTGVDTRRPVDIAGANMAELFRVWVVANQPVGGFPREMPEGEPESEEDEEEVEE